ncbi:hypothetical protein ERJ75_000933400 [Trypanosoma vivax]|uniref:Myb-like domain-containing protein n=1 Tax=Trypanosoma vivax (strain Y486) TaxID=1055687 RepID=G0U445_TRYVY|nr:hypothetical protein TRVL_00667 [Trypanosoma vivax]KAH8611751.1 hypothetical protein ERJ75_000933400 [Trypanosoma vivax]CCC52207.1 conserved hypothetical protein [Trypanosoma vivax Y486]
MSETPQGAPLAPSEVNFELVHEIMRRHLRRGCDFAVLAVIALDFIHNQPHFWRTCDYRDGIAAAVISSSVCLPSPYNCHSPRAKPLTKNELFMILRAVGSDNPNVAAVIKQIEATGNELQTEVGGCMVNAIFGRIPDVCTFLRGRYRAHGVGDLGPEQPLMENDTLHSLSLKRPREACREVSEAVTSGEGVPVTCEGTERGHDPVSCSEVPNEEQSRDALQVLDQLHVLPGSRCTVSSFDAVGDLLGGKGRDSGTDHGKQLDPFLVPLDLERGGKNSGGTSYSRQRRFKFTEEEDAAIQQGLIRFPKDPGRFKRIFYAYQHVWRPGRTVNQLYDHWRGSLRYRLLQQDGYRGKNSLGARAPPSGQ